MSFYCVGNCTVWGGCWMWMNAPTVTTLYMLHIVLLSACGKLTTNLWWIFLYFYFLFSCHSRFTLEDTHTRINCMQLTANAQFVQETNNCDKHMFHPYLFSMPRLMDFTTSTKGISRTKISKSRTKTNQIWRGINLSPLGFHRSRKSQHEHTPQLTYKMLHSLLWLLTKVSMPISKEEINEKKVWFTFRFAFLSQETWI